MNMDATMDSYTQATVFLDEKDVKALDEKGEAYGTIWITSRENMPQPTILLIYIRETGWRFETGAIGYELDFTREGLGRIKQGKTIGTEFPVIGLRVIYISRKDVY
jgi:hypothetical protein